MTGAAMQFSQALGHEAADKRLDILRRTGEVGSISEAARGAGVSYKAAWQAIETLSNLAGRPLVEKAVGGAGGGGAQLTEAGRHLLEVAQALQQARATVIARYEAGPSSGWARFGLAGLGLRTSMRNHLPCTVRSVETVGRTARVGLGLPGGAVLFARITAESSELLGLQAGLSAIALCKATAVAVAGDMPLREGVNRLRGTVGRLFPSDQGSEVSVTLQPGLQLVGFAMPEEPLQVGQAVAAAVEESGVVIAVQP